MNDDFFNFLSLFLTGHIAKIQFCAQGCQEAVLFWRKFNISYQLQATCYKL